MMNYNARVSPEWKDRANFAETVIRRELRNRRLAGLTEVAVTFEQIADAWYAGQTPKPGKAVLRTVLAEIQRRHHHLHRALLQVDRPTRFCVIPVNALYFTEQYSIDGPPLPLTRYHRRSGYPSVGFYVVRSQHDPVVSAWSDMQINTGKGMLNAGHQRIEALRQLPSFDAISA